MSYFDDIRDMPWHDRDDDRPRAPDHVPTHKGLAATVAVWDAHMAAVREWNDRDDERFEAFLQSEPGKRWVEKRVAAEMETMRLAMENRAAAWRERADECGVPRDPQLRAIVFDRYMAKTAASIACREAVEFAWENRVPVFRAVGGDFGVGKSVGMARALIKSNCSAMFVPSAAIVASPRNGHSEFNGRWDAWVETELLCIDEIGCERGDPTIVRDLIVERINAGGVTLATTNLDRKDFLTRMQFDGRIKSRLGEAQAKLPWHVWITGDDLRNEGNRQRVLAKRVVPQPEPTEAIRERAIMIGKNLRMKLDVSDRMRRGDDEKKAEATDRANEEHKAKRERDAAILAKRDRMRAEFIAKGNA
jgi:hypothetical protein